MNVDHYTYRVTWSPEDGEYVALCEEMPSMSWLAPKPESALAGIRKVVAEALVDIQSDSRNVGQAS
jgi:predicted RNase H-like HicB family nuclease